MALLAQAGNPEILIDANNQDKVPLIVSFGGLGHGLCEPVFEFKTFLHRNFTCNFIFIRDKEQVWYFKGVQGLGNSVDDMIITLKGIISEINHSKLIVLGTSAGGYAALLFGVLLGADSIISFSPQTFIDRENRAKYKDMTRSSYVEKLYRLDINKTSKYFDILTLDKNQVKMVNKITIVWGSNDPDDKKHVMRMEAWDNVTIKGYSGGHVIVKVLRDNGELLKILKAHI